MKWLRFFIKPSSRDNLRIGRMSAETPFQEIKTQLQQERQKLGDELLIEQLVEEGKILKKLEKKRQNYSELVKTATNNIVTRQMSHENAGGFFWQLQRQKLDAVLTQEQMSVLEEERDWLQARQKIAEELNLKSENWFDLNKWHS
ncbi:hypothetical protein [Legionella jordanis]|uniref:Uncharacterized protein n=1 Tax=Legionella jordanis TaxID=456 RepID=A0A0W0VEC9_9GAMM|nr:hypothetical protein [Legionella jordanis]KTD17993.1 hypothetical protein Ljor_2299 [Legionella jordanis]RMX02317.1 hypothetical protein EAW55_08645 [Legionella jordanis]RMX21198.1 hypothetical protein EAS68_03225 [Legionella jordanis]VEH13915.1 Uncharacterised protein [Legionella jordanis]HAT8714295.1 hypothetical protein [Legionella jordanis]